MGVLVQKSSRSSFILRRCRHTILAPITDVQGIQDSAILSLDEHRVAKLVRPIALRLELHIRVSECGVIEECAEQLST
jgi:hypothetical protein